MTTAYNFFLANAGFSYNPETETKIQGRRRCAKGLAKAETWARENGYSFDWSVDPYVDSSEFSDESPAWQLWVCVMYGPEGEHVSSLHAIDFGRDGSPYGDSYKRVVEAELASEEYPADA